MSIQKFYWHDASSGVSGTLPVGEHSAQSSVGTVTGATTVRSMDGTKGVSQASVTYTTANTTTAQQTWFRTFISSPLARQRIDAGNWQIQLSAQENNSGSNFKVTCVIYAWRPSTGAVVGSLISDFAADTLEPSTSVTVISDATIAGTAVDVLDGDVLVCEVWRDVAVQSGSPSNWTNIIKYDGTTENSTTNEAAFLLAPLPIFMQGEHGPTFNRTTGYPQGAGAGANNITTIALNPGSAVGDVLFIFVGINSNTITSTGVSSSRTSGWTKVESFNDSTNTWTIEVWMGSVTSTGTHTVTVTYSASVAAVITEIDADSYNSSRTSPVWWVSSAGGRHATGSTTNTYPTLTPSVDGAQAYVGLGEPQNTAQVGNTTGYVYNVLDSLWSTMASYIGVVGAQTPNMTQNTTGTGTLAGVIFSDAPIDGSGSIGLKKPALQSAGNYGIVNGPGSLALKKPALSGDTHAFVRSSSTYATSSAGETGFSIALPTGWQQNDVCYIAVEARGTSASINTPSGWTAVGPTFDAFGVTTSVMAVFRRKLQSGDTDPVAFTGASARWAAVAVAVQKADGTTPEDGVAVSENVQSAATNSPVANAVTPTALNDLLLCFFGAGDPQTANVAMTFSAPAGMTLINQASSAQAGATDAGIMAASLPLTSNSSTGTKTATITPSSGSTACNSQAVTLVVRSIGKVIPILTGTGSIGLKKPALSLSGFEEEVGTGSVALKKPALSAAGKPRYLITGSVALKKPALSIAANEKISGTGSAAIKKPALAASGTVTDSGVAGNGSIALKKPALSIAAKEKISGTGSMGLKKPALSISAKEKISATGSVALKKPALSTSGTEKISGTGSIGLKKPALSIAAKEKDSATGSVALKKPALSISAREKISGTGSAALKKPALFIFSSNNVSGSGGAGLKKPGISAAGKPRYLITGSASLKKPQLTAHGGPYIAGTASMGLKKPSLTISAKEREAATGSASLKKPSLSASGTVTYHSIGTGSIGLKKPSLSLAGSESIFGTGSIHMKKMRLDAHEFSVPANALFAFWPV
jgi:hypothetical protein